MCSGASSLGRLPASRRGGSLRETGTSQTSSKGFKYKRYSSRNHSSPRRLENDDTHNLGIATPTLSSRPASRSIRTINSLQYLHFFHRLPFIGKPLSQIFYAKQILSKIAHKLTLNPDRSYNNTLRMVKLMVSSSDSNRC